MTDRIERQCDTCSAHVYPTDSDGAILWLPLDGEPCKAGLHAVSGFADAGNTLEFERRRDAEAALTRESATPTEDVLARGRTCDACGLHIYAVIDGDADVWAGTRDPQAPCTATTNGKHYYQGNSDPGWADPDVGRAWATRTSPPLLDPNLPSSHAEGCDLRDPGANPFEACTCGVIPTKFYVTGTEPASVDHGQYSYTPAEAQTEPLDMSDTSAKWAHLGESIAESLAEAAKPWAKLAEEIQAGFRKPESVVARIKEGLPLDDQAFKVGAFGDNIDEASWHRVDPDRPGQSLCGEPSALWPYVMRSALPLLGQPTCSVCDNLVGEVRPYMTASGQLVNLPSGVQPVDVKPLLEHALIAPAGWSAPADQVYDLISNLPPLHEGTDMDHDNDEPTTDAETPEFHAFQKRDELARMIRDVINDELEEQLTAEEVNDITLATAEMLLSNYFMREVER